MAKDNDDPPEAVAGYLRRLAHDGAAVYPGRAEILLHAADLIDTGQGASLDEAKRILGARDGELLPAAAHRVVTERDQAVDELSDEQRKRQLAEGFHREKARQADREIRRADRAETELARMAELVGAEGTTVPTVNPVAIRTAIRELVDERRQYRDQADDLAATISQLAEGLGVPYEPHQSFHDRLVEAANHAGGQLADERNWQRNNASAPLHPLDPNYDPSTEDGRPAMHSVGDAAKTAEECGKSQVHHLVLRGPAKSAKTEAAIGIAEHYAANGVEVALVVPDITQAKHLKRHRVPFHTNLEVLSVGDARIRGQRFRCIVMDDCTQIGGQLAAQAVDALEDDYCTVFWVKPDDIPEPKDPPRTPGHTPVG